MREGKLWIQTSKIPVVEVLDKYIRTFFGSWCVIMIKGGNGVGEESLNFGRGGLHFPLH